MKFLVTPMLLVSLLFTSSGQAQVRLVTLEPEQVSLNDRDFYIKEVIDARDDKHSIGVAKVGVFNNKVTVDLQHGVEKALKQFLDSSLPKEKGQIGLILKVGKLSISDKSSFTNSSGRVDVTLDFYITNESSIAKVYTAKVVYKTKALNVMKQIPESVKTALLKGVKEFDQSKWQDVPPVFEDRDVLDVYRQR
ncbi:hypothetical protein AAG747_03850 [Rapidithrix thailandica]|uniref:DUF4468 domain-containing protein n=1 Tax=Rapidithrix thailandica TaxID=413964 RepID=A0AAW9S3R4_9BACT